MHLNSDNECARQLGAALRSRRMVQGMSLRVLAQHLHLTGHGTLIDYEYGRRIPSEDLVLACERVLRVPDGQLQDLRRRALAERAERCVDELLGPPGTPDASDRPQLRSRRPRGHVVL